MRRVNVDKKCGVSANAAFGKTSMTNLKKA
jgi:hypothetical protein